MLYPAVLFLFVLKWKNYSRKQDVSHKIIYKKKNILEIVQSAPM